MNIGQASKASGVSSKMIRYYEHIGLIKPAHRTDSSYRTYADNDIHTLSFIRRARDLGFSVEQMKTLLALWRDRDRASADVKAIALEQIAELERKAAAIAEMTRTLKHLARNCHGVERPDREARRLAVAHRAPPAVGHRDEGPRRRHLVGLSRGAGPVGRLRALRPQEGADGRDLPREPRTAEEERHLTRNPTMTEKTSERAAGKAGEKPGEPHGGDVARGIQQAPAGGIGHAQQQARPKPDQNDGTGEQDCRADIARARDGFGSRPPEHVRPQPRASDQRQERAEGGGGAARVAAEQAVEQAQAEGEAESEAVDAGAIGETGGTLAEGTVEDGCVRCPWHNSEFDLSSGEVKEGPAKAPLKRYEVLVRENRITVRVDPNA